MDDSESSPSPIEDMPIRSRRDTDQSRREHRSSKDRARTYAAGSTREFARLFVLQERETMELRKKLELVTEQLRSETLRADAAESKAREAALRYKSANDAKLIAQQEVQRANEALNMYKLQLNNAQREIDRAQQILDAVEAQRLDAEEAAARARSTARRLKEEKIYQNAREEGRRQGLEEGLARGRSIGFEEGREEGYARATAAGTPRPYVEDAEDEGEEGITDDQPSGPSSSPPDDYESRPPSQYSQMPAQNFASSRRAATPAAPSAPLPVPESPKNTPIHPTIIHNMIVSPSHPPVDYPPDTFIPKLDNDDRIRLPPPHEFGPPPTPSPPSSAVLQNVPLQDVPDDGPPLRVPPPAADYGGFDSDSTTGTTNRRRTRHARRRSSESLSTTMSQLEILRPPPSESASMHHVVRERPSVLSAISEERERTSSMSSPVPTSNSPYAQSSGSALYRSSPQAPVTDTHRYEDGHRTPAQNIYMRPSRSPISSPDSGRNPPLSTNLPPPSQVSQSRRSSLSPEIPITVEPPSGPESPASRNVPTTPHLLSANDLPSPHDDFVGTSGPPQQPVGQDMSGMPMDSGPIPVIADGQLPPGFQPIGPPIAPGVFAPMTGPQVSLTPQTVYSTSIGSIGPAGVPLPPSTYGGTPSIVGSTVPGAIPAEPVVIPNLMPSAAPGSAAAQAASRYSRTALRDSSSDSDVSSGLGGSMDSLTTPPARRRQISTHSTPTPAYAVAPIPPNVTYPVPPTPRSTGSRTTAARVPLPPSTAASVASPTSTTTYPYAQTPYMYNRSSAALDAGRTPMAMNRPLSPVIGSSRMTPVPSPAQLEPRTSLYEPRSRTHEDNLPQSIASASSAPMRPPSVARLQSSPTISSVSLAPSNTTSKSKKSKKAKKKSRIASVEEAPEEE